MSHPNASRRSPRTHEATTLERERTTVLVERSRKPRSKADSKTRKAKTHGLECRTVLIEPPKKPHITVNWNKMLFTKKSQPVTKAILAKYPPNKDKFGLDVIRIPCDGSRFQVKSIPLIGIGHDGIRFEDCVAAEDWLKQFPDVQSVADKSNFNWKNRSLIGIPAEDLGSSVNEMYFMYVCYEVKTGLPHNKYLENLSGVQMFGDGYLFKVYKDFDEDGRPIFLDMGSVSAIDLKNGGVTKECVQKLLDLMTGDVGKAKR